MCRILAFGLIVVAVAAQTYAARIPDGQLRVAYRQDSEGELSKSVHQIILECWKGECSLTTLTLNQCFDTPEGKAFFPRIESTHTSDGTLTVSLPEPNVVSAREDYGDTTFTYRFTYASREQSGSRRFASTRDFSGAVVKDSEILGKVVTWKLVPLKGEFVKVKLDCAANLFGIP